MVKGVLDSTSTSNDFYTLFDNLVATNPHLEKTITEVRNETNLFLCKILRFYTMRDLCWVKELNTGEEYMCHMTHEMLSYEVSLNCMCDGNVKQDNKYGSYIEPYSDIYGVVANVRFRGTRDEKCLLSCLNYQSDNSLFSSVRNGEIRLKVGNSTLSLTGSRINLMTPTLLVNGLPYDEPKLNNYYDKSEINTIKSDSDAKIKELNEKIGSLDIEAITALINELGDLDVDLFVKDSDLNDYVKKSSTTGLLKNDGTVDTSTYVKNNDNRLNDARTPLPHRHNASDIDGLNVNLDNYDVSFDVQWLGTGGVDDRIKINIGLVNK